jgi:hypothetical protein
VRLACSAFGRRPDNDSGELFINLCHVRARTMRLRAGDSIRPYRQAAFPPRGVAARIGISGITRRRLRLALVIILVGMMNVAAFIPNSLAQPTATTAPASAALPDPIYWKQQLFLIPYQWGSAAEPGAARAVYLFVSKDRGASWQKISEARPQVKAFNYRAECDGEFWFACRTIDNAGRSWPEGAYQPELRVIVDTKVPRIERLLAWRLENGNVEIQWSGADENLDPASWRFEAQMMPAGPFQPIALQQVAAVAAPTSVGAMGAAAAASLHAAWQPPAGSQSLAIRASVSDRAGNTATYNAQIQASVPMTGPALAPAFTSAASTIAASRASPTVGGLLSASPNVSPSMPVAITSSAATPAVGVPTTATPPSQPWPASATTSAPFQLWTKGSTPTDDGVTAYGNPSVSAAPAASNNMANDNDAAGRVSARYAAITAEPHDANASAPGEAPAQSAFRPLEPFREEMTAATPTTGNNNPVPIASPAAPSVTPIEAPPLVHTPLTPPKRVGSRTFALEYDLSDFGRGVASIELWGTRDGGQSWRMFAKDDDNRSPMVATVDGEGRYGFRIVVQSVGKVAKPPASGDEPELWVDVDLQRPTIELTSIERGEGNAADQLILRWRANDNNLERRPIALFYSSRPTGPWSAVATNLENTGVYAWRVERYVPSQFYLRIEARDTAGNLAAFQTRDPVALESPDLTGRLLGAQQVH